MTTAANKLLPGTGNHPISRWKQFVNRAVELLGGPAVTYQRILSDRALNATVATTGREPSAAAPSAKTTSDAHDHLLNQLMAQGLVVREQADGKLVLILSRRELPRGTGEQQVQSKRESR